MSDTAALLAIAVDAARAAGAQLRAAFAGPELRTATKTSPTDPVSEADIAAESLIRARLQAQRPDDALLGEEGGGAAGRSGLRWIVDPLDGTVNFLFGIPQWSVSIAVEDATGTLAGVVLDPLRDELWTARADDAARCNGAPVTGSQRTELAAALVATGFGYEAAVRAHQAAVAAALLPRVRDIRRFGSAALDLAWTAAGRFDAYYERGLHAWDVAAGALICERAGLDVRALAPDPPAADGVLAAPPALADALEPLVAGPSPPLPSTSGSSAD